MCYQVLLQTIDDAINLKIFYRSAYKAMTKGEKRGGYRNRKFHYLEKEKSFLGEIKSILRNYLCVSFGETMKKLQAQPLTSSFVSFFHELLLSSPYSFCECVNVTFNFYLLLKKTFSLQLRSI